MFPNYVVATDAFAAWHMFTVDLDISDGLIRCRTWTPLYSIFILIQSCFYYYHQVGFLDKNRCLCLNMWWEEVKRSWQKQKKSNKQSEILEVVQDPLHTDQREPSLCSAVACRKPKHASKPRWAYLKSSGRADWQGFPSAVSRPQPRWASIWREGKKRGKQASFLGGYF